MFSVPHLNELRMIELDSILPYLPARCRILEIGAGTGRQALALSQKGFDVSAIDIPSSESLPPKNVE